MAYSPDLGTTILTMTSLLDLASDLLVQNGDRISGTDGDKYVLNESTYNQIVSVLIAGRAYASRIEGPVN